MNNSDIDFRKFMTLALVCGISYAIGGPVGLAVIALIALIRTAKKDD